MASILKVDKLDPQSGTALEIGTSGDTVSIPSGATLDISASTLTPPATMPASSGINFTALNATNLGSGTVPTARLGTGTASSSTVLYGDQTYKAEPGGGKVLQVINATTTTETASSSTTYADTTLTAAITPASTSNTVLVLINQTGLLKHTTDNAGKIQLLRDATAIGMFENDFGRDGGTGLNIVGGSGYCKLDSPSSTSELTYKTQFACSVTAASSLGVQHNSCVSSITLMEIGA